MDQADRGQTGETDLCGWWEEELNIGDDGGCKDAAGSP
jgi:hypothetical protein